MKEKIAISVGDLNGIGIELLLRRHDEIARGYEPFYFIHEGLLRKAMGLLKLQISGANFVSFSNSKKRSFEFIKENNLGKFFHFACPLDFEVDENFKIKAGQIDKKSGAYSFLSFAAATSFVKEKLAQKLITLPIHKKAWEMAGIKHKGHTEFLRTFFKKRAIMMLGCQELFVALFTEHVPLDRVSKMIKFKPLCHFLRDLYLSTGFNKIALLGFNPHAGDDGVIGGAEEEIMRRAICFVNTFLNLDEESAKKKYKMHLKLLFDTALKDENLQEKIINNTPKMKNIYLPDPIVADSAFTPEGLKKCNRLVAMYHDLALAPLKALYFEKSINVSLNLPILRSSVDHGTAFDKAYKNEKLSMSSYLEAVRIKLIKN